MPEPFLRGLSTARLSGRAQIVDDSTLLSSAATRLNGCSSGDLIFYLDGAHSPESMEACARWFSSAVKEGQSPFPNPAFSSKLQTSAKAWSSGNAHPGKSERGEISKQVWI